MVVGWICKKQSSVALSTMEAEFVAASQGTAEMLGIVELLSEIGIKVEVPYKLHVDNQAAIKQIEGEDTSGRAKHIDIRLKFIKDLSRNKGLNVSYCESKLMRADILTKTLPAPRLEELGCSSCSRRDRARRSVGTRNRCVRWYGRLRTVAGVSSRRHGGYQGLQGGAVVARRGPLHMSRNQVR
ncbi:hypothetical protein PR002_g20705 [Phytophthora rubi]|uniref:Reverse transcriptase Ty1/copia-type domain-containing protein n=1 Tax=Phytophthora rubi TaxID=129364 RepID=A0A6A3JHG1_9STRA|nr:hypothetical protein PR002_g20705 [Phytophthora rubi]